MNVGTFEVLASAYVRQQPAASYLTHAAELDADGFPVRTLCKAVKLASLVSTREENMAVCPTCPTCAKRDPRFKVTP